MNKEQLELLKDLEQKAVDALNECWGYECIEYDNGTYECDDCPFYEEYCRLTREAEKLLNT